VNLSSFVRPGRDKTVGSPTREQVGNGSEKDLCDGPCKSLLQQ